MRKYDNGIYRDMTDEEVSAWEQSIADTTATEPTTDERIAALEATTDDIVLMMAELIGGE